MEIVTALLLLVYVVFGALLLALLVVGLSVLLKVNSKLKNDDKSRHLSTASKADPSGINHS